MGVTPNSVNTAHDHLAPGDDCGSFATNPDCHALQQKPCNRLGLMPSPGAAVPVDEVQLQASATRKGLDQQCVKLLSLASTLLVAAAPLAAMADTVSGPVCQPGRRL